MKAIKYGLFEIAGEVGFLDQVSDYPFFPHYPGYVFQLGIIPELIDVVTVDPKEGLVSRTFVGPRRWYYGQSPFPLPFRVVLSWHLWVVGVEGLLGSFLSWIFSSSSSLS